MKVATRLTKVVFLFLFNNGLYIFCVYGHPTTTSLSNQKCNVPATFLDKAVSYKCKGETAEKSCYKIGETSVSQYTTAEFECNSGYVREEGKKFYSVCIDTEWQPPIAKCSKKCDKLNPINVNLNCFYRGAEVECDDNLLPGTKVRPTCKPLHTYEASFSTYEEITCKQNGKWDHELFSCAPDCGKPFAFAEPLIAFGEPEQYGDSPWNVAIYEMKEKLLICGGTIISPQLIVTASDCFYDQIHGTRGDVNNYEIIVSKVTRNYTIRDNGSQKNYKIKEIRYPKKGVYIGSGNSTANNIAIVILNEKIAMSPTVLPACVDWALKKKIPPTEDSFGKIVGWGLNGNQNYSEILHNAKLPYISYDRCLKLLPVDRKPFLTSNKFCAGKKNGPTVELGDSGAGLMFLEKDRYFIRGLLVLKFRSEAWLAIFIDLNDHVDWMLSVRKEVEHEIIQKETTHGSKNINKQK